jgi:hypothetical protein
MKNKDIERLLDDATKGQKTPVHFERLGVYEYRADGRYHGANWVDTPEAFVEMIPRLSQHIVDGKELRITDASDRLLFHAKDKTIEWDGIGISPLLESAKKASPERTPER